MTILRVTYTVDYEVDGPLPNPAVEDAVMALMEALMDTAPDAPVNVGECDLTPFGWRLDAGIYGDLGTGMAPERPTGPRPSAAVVPKEADE